MCGAAPLVWRWFQWRQGLNKDQSIYELRRYWSGRGRLLTMQVDVKMPNYSLNAATISSIRVQSKSISSSNWAEGIWGGKSSLVHSVGPTWKRKKNNIIEWSGLGKLNKVYLPVGKGDIGNGGIGSHRGRVLRTGLSGNGISKDNNGREFSGGVCGKGRTRALCDDSDSFKLDSCEDTDVDDVVDIVRDNPWNEEEDEDEDEDASLLSCIL